MTIYRIKTTVRGIALELFFRYRPTEQRRGEAVDRFFTESGIEEKKKLLDQVQRAVNEAQIEEIEVFQ